MVRLLVVLGLVLCGAPSWAATFYFDSTCSNNGDGTSSSCASSGGAAGAYNSAAQLLTTFGAVTAGDIISCNGDFATTNGSGAYDSGFAITHSGTSGNPITIRSTSGQGCLLRNCASGSTTHAACDRATVTMYGQSYINIDRLSIVGAIGVHSGATTQATTPTGNQITNTTCTRGYASAGDGNWSCFYISYQQDIILRNLICDSIFELTGAGDQTSASCVKVYSSFDGLFEYILCRDIQIAESQSGCYDDKEASVRNTWRYLWCQDSPGCFRLQNQRGKLDPTVPVEQCVDPGNENACGYAATGTVLSHAVFWLGTVTGTHDCIRYEDGAIDDFIVHHVTCVGFANGAQSLNSGGNRQTNGIQMYSNIFANLTDRNVVWFGDDSDITKLDHNCWDSDSSWQLDSTYTDIAALRAGTPFEDNGVETASSFGFVDAANGNFHLSGGSCAGQGSTNGTTVDNDDPGAYGSSVRCVGYGCLKPTGVTVN